MDIKAVSNKAQEISNLYNPDGVSPFPYENILKDIKELEIYLVDFEEEVSGAIEYNKEEKMFLIFINQKKAEVRQNFTIAHELGHYFLHQEYIKNEEGLVDGENFMDGNPALFRSNVQQSTMSEIQANTFAAGLLMPEALVRKAWQKIADIRACAEIFAVSASAMSIRLEKLGLIK